MLSVPRVKWKQGGSEILYSYYLYFVRSLSSTVHGWVAWALCALLTIDRQSKIIPEARYCVLSCDLLQPKNVACFWVGWIGRVFYRIGLNILGEILAAHTERYMSSIELFPPKCNFPYKVISSIFSLVACTETVLTVLVLSYSGKIKLLVIVGFLCSQYSRRRWLAWGSLMYLRYIFWCSASDCKLK